MGKQYKKFSSEEKVRILRRHLLEKEPVSKVCEANDLHPNVFYKWQKEFFENGAAAFEKKPGTRERKLEENITRLEKRISHKDEVIAEIMESHVQLKKNLGES